MTVQHDREAGRFLVRVSSGTAVLSYADRGELLDIYRTYVPPADRGRGIGGLLVEAALAYARERGCRVIPSCWYVRQWVEEHPEARDLLAA